MELNEEFEIEETAGERGMKWMGRVIAVAIILIVSAFGDVMYLDLMQSHFPGGLLLVLCYIGAFTSLLAVIYMLVGKSVLFTPGPQMVTAWFVFCFELLLIGLNICLAVSGDSVGGFLAVWNQIAPATPVANMAGVAILFFLDESQRMKHEDVELAWDMKRATRRHFKATAKARLKLQNKQLSYLITELDRAVSSPESLAAISQTAYEMNLSLLGTLSGGRTYRNVQALPQPASQPALPPPSEEKIVSGSVVPESASQSVPESAAQPQPASQPQPAKKPRNRVMRFLDHIAGATAPKQQVTLAQTGTIAAPATPAQPTPVLSSANRPGHRPTRHARNPRPGVAQNREARRQARLSGMRGYSHTPANAATILETFEQDVKPASQNEPTHSQASGPEYRQCSECPTKFEVKNAKQQTCSDKCRQARSRRLAKVRAGK